MEFLPCLCRDAANRIQGVAFPKGEPDRNRMFMDLYCPYYEVKKGLFGSARITDIGISIFNRPSYRRDEALVEEARERLIQAVLSKEAPEVIAASGGIAELRKQATAEEFYR